MWVSNLEDLGLQKTDPNCKLISTTGPLSILLQNKCKQLSVQVISQQIENHKFIREVYLLGDGTPWVHAITTAQHRTYLRFKTELDNLGNNLLGKSLLYSQPHTRSAFEYAMLDGNLARRSVFDLQGYKITIQEKFLEAIF